MSPGAALHTHLELADIPIIDKATLAILGNDDFLLSMIRDDASPQMIEDYVAWTVGSTRALGVKVINAGAAAAFKENVRTFSLDDVVPSYGVSSRKIVKTLQAAVDRLGHSASAACPLQQSRRRGAADTAAATIAAAEGVPLHLAHLQFYGYGTEGKRKFSSAAARLAELVNATPEVTIDIGQVMFGQTVTISSDVMRQFSARGYGASEEDRHPRRRRQWRRHRALSLPPDFYGTLQWAVGLELFLLIDDPWRVFFTTDHPNGAPFTVYPALFELLMDRDARNEMASTVSQAAQWRYRRSPSIDREYTFEEIAIMTRAAPAKLLGLKDRGHLGAGAIADVAVYRKDKNIAKMLGAAALVFKNGDLVVKDGEITHYRWGKALRLNPPPDSAIVRRLEVLSRQRYGLSLDWFTFPDVSHRARNSHSGRCHAAPEGQRRIDRRYLCGSLRHARDRDRHHRRRTANGRGRRRSR